MIRESESNRPLHLKPMRKRRTGTLFAALFLSTFGLAACGSSGGGDGDNNNQQPQAQNTCVFDRSTFDNCTIAQ